MRTIRVAVRDGDPMAGDVGSREGAIACVKQACPELSDEEAARVAHEAMARQISTSVEPFVAVLADVLGPDVMIERS